MKTIKLTHEQAERLAEVAAETGMSKSEIADDVLRGYLHNAFDITYPPGPRRYPGKRKTSNRWGMHAFLFSPAQETIIDDVLDAVPLSWAQLFEAAAADQFLDRYGTPWIYSPRKGHPFGRPSGRDLAKTA